MVGEGEKSDSPRWCVGESVVLHLRRLTALERENVDKIVRPWSTPARLRERARTVSYVDPGHSVPEVAALLHLN